MDIEEDIKILENLKKYLNLLIYEGTHKIIYNDLGWDEKTIDCINAIDHILEEREENRKYTIHLTDEQYRKTIENAQKDVKDKYKKKIEELEEIDEANRKVIAEQCDYIQNKSIPKQKVKDKIEEVKLSGGGNGKNNVENLARELVIDVLEELLEEGE